MFATKASTVSTNYPQTHHSRPRSTPKHAVDRDLRCIYSDASNLVKYPNVEGIRKVHAEAVNRSTEGQRRESDRRVASRTFRRTQSDSRTYMMKNTEETAHEVRRRGDSEHRHRSHRSKREEGRPRGDTAHVPRTRSREGTDRDRPQYVGQPKTTREASRSRPERSHREDKEPIRRQSERRTSHREETDHIPLRRERRSIAEGTEKRSREEPPVKRYSARQHSEETRTN